MRGERVGAAKSGPHFPPWKRVPHPLLRDFTLYMKVSEHVPARVWPCLLSSLPTSRWPTLVPRMPQGVNAWFTRAAKRVLLLPRAEPPPSPPLPPPPVAVLLEAPLQTLPRSCVTHAVLGSEAAGLHSLPAEILMQTFQMLDPVTLCRLAQASKTCQLFADDPLVWEPSQGHRKAVERACRWHAAQLRAAAEAAEAAERRQRWRQRKRCLLSVLEVMCGVLVVVCAMLFSSRSRRKEAPLGAVCANQTAVACAEQRTPTLPSRAPSSPPGSISDVVSKAAGLRLASAAGSPVSVS